MNRRFAAGCAFSVLGCLVVAGSALADRLADALVAHKAAVESIDTIYFKFESSIERKGRSAGTAGEYWRTRDAQRLTYTQPGISESVYTFADKLIAVNQYTEQRTGQPISRASIAPNAGPVGVSVAPWRDALFALDSHRGLGTQSLADHLAEFLVGARYSVEAGKGVITKGNGAVTIRLDPKYNYLICGKTSRIYGVKSPTPPPATQTINEEVQEFQQVEAGIYFPKKVVIDEHLGEERRSRRTVTFSAVRLNKPVNATVFQPRYRDGTQVNDEVRGTKYRVDSAGNLQGQEVPLTKIAVGAHSAGEEARQPALPTADEERLWGWWLLPAGLSVALFGMAVIVWRRIKPAGDPARPRRRAVIANQEGGSRK